MKKIDEAIALARAEADYIASVKHVVDGLAGEVKDLKEKLALSEADAAKVDDLVSQMLANKDLLADAAAYGTPSEPKDTSDNKG